MEISNRKHYIFKSRVRLFEIFKNNELVNYCKMTMEWLGLKSNSAWGKFEKLAIIFLLKR